MATLLEICQHVARKSRIKVPRTIIGNVEKNANLIYECVVEAYEELAREYNWTQLTTYVEFGVPYGKSSVQLGEDFDRLVDDTVWGISENRPLAGPLTFEEWQQIEHGIVTPKTSCFSIKRPSHIGTDTQPTINIWSISSGGQGTESTPVSFYRVSKNHIYPTLATTLRDTFIADTDESVLDSLAAKRLSVAKTLQALGMSYADEKASYEDLMMERVARDQGSMRISLNQRSNPRYRADKYRFDPIWVNVPGVSGW